MFPILAPYFLLVNYQLVPKKKPKICSNTRFFSEKRREHKIPGVMRQVFQSFTFEHRTSHSTNRWMPSFCHQSQFSQGILYYTNAQLPLPLKQCSRFYNERMPWENCD